jgi:carbon storage regulator CsrA
MLTITRAVGESILIGDQIRLQVTKVTGHRTEIAIDIPDALRVTRGECRELMRSQQKESAHARARA